MSDLFDALFVCSEVEEDSGGRVFYLDEVVGRLEEGVDEVDDSV